MKRSNDAALSLLASSQSLNDLLFILRNICKNLDLREVKPYLKQSASFRFVFFGLLTKAKGTLQIMLFRTENLEPERVKELRKELLAIQRQLEKATRHINEKHLTEGQQEIIAVTEEYEKLFPQLQKEVNRLL